MRLFRITLVWALFIGQVCPALAEEDLAGEVRELRKAVQALTQTVQKQQRQIDQLKRANRDLETQVQQEAPVSPVTPVPTPVTQPPTATYGQKTGLQAFNPEIGMVADVVAVLGESDEDAEGNDKISVRELELAIGHDVDPYSRFDSTITLSDFEDVTVEEAYISHWGLPFDFKGKLGRMRPKVGKATAVHRDQMDTVDEPLVVQKYLGVEGLFRTGLELTQFLPQFADPLTQEITLGVMEGGIGEEGTLFGTTRRRPSFYSHLKNFFDLSDETSWELGLTHLTGSIDTDADYEVHALGLDGTFIHYVTPNNKLKWQNEAYFQFRDETASGLNDQPFGFYSLLDYRLNPYFGVGGRFDYVEPVDHPAASPRDADSSFSTYLTFYQSEFARWRAQYRHTENATGDNEDAFLLQGTVAIGVHKHQIK